MPGGTPAQAGSQSPSVEEVADAVVRATARTAGAFAARCARNPSPGGSCSHRDTRPLDPAQRRTPDFTPPISAAGPLYRVLEGTIVDTVLTNRLDGAMAAPVNCLVTNALYSHTGRQVLVPAGARILGETKPVQTFGETRLAVSFHRLLMPDGRSYRLDEFMGLNQIGDAGLRDKVNHHYLSTFGAAAAVGLISGLSQYPGKRRTRQRRREPNDCHRRRRGRRHISSRDAGHESVSQSAADDHHSRGASGEGVPHQRHRAAGVHRTRRLESVLNRRTLCFAESCCLPPRCA